MNYMRGEEDEWKKARRGRITQLVGSSRFIADRSEDGIGRNVNVGMLGGDVNSRKQFLEIKCLLKAVIALIIDPVRGKRNIYWDLILLFYS